MEEDQRIKETQRDKYRKFHLIEEVEPMFLRGERDWSVDILRCISCFMVCILHAFIFSERYGFTTDVGSSEWTHYFVYRMIFGSPTVLFVMVSGIFFLSPERSVKISKVWRKNIIKMVFAYIFWSFIYALYRIYMMDPQPEITWDFLFNEWIVEPYHMWYIPMIIGLYIMAPILRPITATKDTNLFKYIIVVFVGALILSTIFNWPRGLDEGDMDTSMLIIQKTPMAALCRYPFWMLYGWIVYTYRPTRYFRYLIYFLGILATIVGIWCNLYNWNLYEELSVVATTQKFSILIIIKNTALFYFIVTVFRNHKFSNIGKTILRKLSANTLIIYLIHMLIIYLMYDNNFLWTNDASPWIVPWIYALIAYFAGAIIAELFHIFWDPIKKGLFPKDKERKKSKRQRRKERRLAREARLNERRRSEDN